MDQVHRDTGCKVDALHLTNVLFSQIVKYKNKEMKYFHVVVLFSLIIIGDGELWYSATGIDKDKAKSTKAYDTEYLQTEGGFVPLIVKNFTKSVDIDPNKWHFKRKKLDLNYAQNSNLSVAAHPNATLLRYLNNVRIINVAQTKKTNNKLIRKKCRPMSNKKLLGKGRTRFLEVFEVVEFEHVACISSSGLEGTCLPENECQNTKGSPMGTCADGYGTCCVIEFKCDDHTVASSGWFTNPGFPSPSTERLSCALSIHKSSEDIKQLRLDFMNFELLPPTGGTCQEDQFIVSGQNVNNMIPIICGVNTGQHIYIEVGETEGPIILAIQTVSPDSRLFSIKITQVSVTDELAAPTGCFQYFTETQGIIESLNYRDKSDIGIARTPQYLNNLNYAICISRAAQTCSVTYTNSNYYMQIVNYDADGLPVIPKGQAGVEIFNCPSDWLLISATRLCGERLNDGSVVQDFSLDAPVTDYGAGPIVVWFRTDEGYVGRGFQLRYQQNACS
ncbi:uncharacterized protein LOC128671812 isoform X1 [Plodia interpunctella]|uniref:uncharacterized protein LOC128671812 isoform X1 n=1 Tax=Plodia interpunctella TaxID=58824 RepID=UPI002368ED73|nr:uncharacterized protein LOC128671812 isoform X1 [Plodia interpunctella]